MIKIVVGNSVEGDNFFGREAELEALLRLVESDHVLLLAPRRVGKSSLLRAVPERAAADGRIAAYADVQGCKSEASFVATLLTAIHATPAGRAARPGRWTRWRAHRKSRLKSVSAPGGIGAEFEPVDVDWQIEADRAFDRVLALDQRWLILVDELPNVVVALAAQDPTGERVRAFLSWFRRLRQRPDAATKLRFVLCGSIGLDNVARRYRISDTINDLRVWPLGPFDEPTAIAFLETLAVAYEWTLTPAVCARILHEVEWLIPHHLQGVMSELQTICPRGTIDEAHVEQAIAALIARRSYFNSWDERLTPSLGAPTDEHARAILTVCARDPRGVTRTTLSGALADAIAEPKARASAITELLEILGHDGYLVDDGDRVRFRSSILRRYWLKHFA